MAAQELVFEGVWAYPNDFPFFLQKWIINFQVRNKSGRRIQIERVGCTFQIEDDLEPYTPIVPYFLILENGHLSRPIPIEFEVDLALKAGTNYYHIVVYYHDENSQTVEHDPRKYLILNSPAPGEKSFFISHKDQENTKS